MPVKIAINGYGRIGRNVLRALYEGDKRNEIQIIAIRNSITMGRIPYLTITPM